MDQRQRIKNFILRIAFIFFYRLDSKLTFYQAPPTPLHQAYTYQNQQDN